MPARHTRTHIYLAAFLTVVLGFVLPPSVNLNRFRGQISEAVSRSVGRPVTLQDVHLRLLPLPGLTFRHLRITDDPEFGGEPIISTSEEDGQQSLATLRLTSLWRGRFEIASISLTQASLNLVHSADGHWNLERLINRAAQVPTAPTAKHKAEARARFPYIELKESRINFKIGQEKKPFTLFDSEFALWLAAENRWNVRLKSVPLRTDETLSDTGVIKLSGSFDRASQFADTPFHLQISWEHPQANQIFRIAHGYDPGWRGTVDLNADLKGTPNDFVAKVNGNIDQFRRYDIARSTSLDVRVSCENRFRVLVPQTNATNQLDFKCRLPLDGGSLSANGMLARVNGHEHKYSIRLFASEVPVSALLRVMLHAKSTLPDDLRGDGSVNGDWSIEGSSGAPAAWAGSLSVADASLHSAVLTRPLVFPTFVKFNFEPAGASNRNKNAQTSTELIASRAVVAPFALNLGGNIQVSAAFTTAGYQMTVRGPADWQELLGAARLIGLHPPPNDLRGSGVVRVEYAGQWHGFAPPSVTGEAQIKSAQLSLKGFNEPLRVSNGVLKFDAQSFSAQHLAARFPRNGLEFTANLSGSRQCEQHIACNLNFDVQVGELRSADLVALLAPRSSGIPIPFFNSGRKFEASWLVDVPASGSISAQHLTIRKLRVKDMNAQLEIAGGKIAVRRWSGELLGGRHTGDWSFDFTGERPAITGSGRVERATMDEIGAAIDQQVGTGALDVQYRIAMTGSSAAELAASLDGGGTFSWQKGELRSLPSETESSAPLTFSLWSGQFAVRNQSIEFAKTQMISPSIVREVAGQIAFDRGWNMRFVSANGSGFAATGTIANPVISTDLPKLTRVEARQ